MRDKLSQQEFLDRSHAAHGPKYDYGKSIYVAQYKNVIITCPIHGDFSQMAKNHFNGFGCNECGNEKISQKNISNIEEFILKAKAVHGGVYSYDNSTYDRAGKQITITCAKHGDFKQAASNHLAGHGCKKCASDLTRIRLTKTQEDFLEKAHGIHGFKYGYENIVYLSCEDKIGITCYKHGVFYQKVSNHLYGQGCPMCGNNKISESRSRTKEQFLEKSNIVHGNKYDYSLVDTINSRDIIKIGCPIHGVFEQRVMDHVSGCGCQKCSVEYNNYHKESWIKRSKNKLGIFYILKVFNDTESFYKYGITFNTIKYRYKKKSSMPYNYEIVRLIISSDKDHIWDLEKRFMRFKQNDRYSPLMPFSGSKYECFSSYRQTIK